MHLAQLNIGLPVAPLDGPELAAFMANLEPVNALADAAPGFVWRLQTEDGDATAIRPYDDDRLLVNMSVWTSVEALAAFVFSGEHRAIMKRRREFFVPMQEAFQVLWWVPEGTTPTVTEAQERLNHLREHGPTPHAFTFRTPFPAPDGPAVRADDAWFCGV
jgi:heme-degrading monooxygenase HmoA